MFRGMSCLSLLVTAAFLLSCSRAPSDQAARYENRADGYVQQEKFREALIEYKNAARATPDNPAIHWKLAKAASKVGDHSTAFTSLSRVVQLDPAHFDAKWALGDLYLAAGKPTKLPKSQTPYSRHSRNIPPAISFVPAWPWEQGRPGRD